VTFDLPNVDKNLLLQELNSYDLKVVARRFGAKVESRDNAIVAGRIYYMYLKKHFAKNIADYTRRLKHKIGTKYADFMTRNADAIDEAITQYEHNNMNIDLMAASKFGKVYLAKSHVGRYPCEPLQMLWMRVAIQMWYAYGIEAVLKCYLDLSENFYIMASPTLFNSCLAQIDVSTCKEIDLNQLASCFLLHMSDNTDEKGGIFQKR